MTSKELVKRTLEFRNTDGRVPRDLWTLPWATERYPDTMRRLNELYAMTDQVGFVGTQRVDGKLILPEAMKVLGMGDKANG